MNKAKISLNGLKSLLSRLSEEEMLNQSLRSNFYRSHPVSKLRLRQLNKYINLPFNKTLFQSSTKKYLDQFLKHEHKKNSDLIEIHNRPIYVGKIFKFNK